MKNIEICLKATEAGKTLTNKEVNKLIQHKLNNPLDYKMIEVGQGTDLLKLKKYLAKKYNCTIHSRVQNGCYGSRDGQSFEGLTIWMHPSDVVDRYIDSDHGECVNPWFLLNEHGTLLDNIDADTFIETAENLEAEIKSDNTYNYSGNNSEDASFIFDFQFDSIRTKSGKVFLVCMFHCGGDPRGNYTGKKVWQFKSEDDIYSVLFPTKELECSEEAE